MSRSWLLCETLYVLEKVVPSVSRSWLLSAVGIWLAVAVGSAVTTPNVEPGNFEGETTLVSPVFDGVFGAWAMADSEVGRLKLNFPGGVEVGRGHRVAVKGELDGVEGRVAGFGYASSLDVRVLKVLDGPASPLIGLGSDMRDWVVQRLAPLEGGRGLLAGFLIGDTSGVPEADVEAMRRSGLAHFVAVSGSNVALFLLVLAVVVGPLALGPRRRAVVGLLGLPLYAAITGFEPSVLRASVMAGIALVGRLVGFVLEAWQLLALAVAVLIFLDPDLTSNVGFQLSVAATAGVLVGARLPAAGWLARSLAVTLGAQVAVAPLLLVNFGTVPLLTPLTNIVSGPLVAVATLLGAAGLLVTPLLAPASWLAGLVLGVARTAEAWPQLGPLGVVVMSVGLLIFWKLRSIRPGLILIAAVVFALGSAHTRGLPPGSVTVLDVGQGDAILIKGDEGLFGLVDGGPDEGVLLRKLRQFGVRRLEFVVMTHVHEDHVRGLTGLIGRVSVGSVYAAIDPHATSASRDFQDLLELHDVPTWVPVAGQSFGFGRLVLRFEGPVRRYASPNDQSVVLMVEGPRQSMLLSGDIETHAQDDLPHLQADILKVPHQGAGTSQPEWLTSVHSKLAVISVGPNKFGHPVPWVEEVLEASGSTVVRTDEEGDVVVDLS